MSEHIIYLDNNATTQVDPAVLESMLPFLTHSYANANSTHKFGADVNNSVKKARKQVSELISSEAHEVVFTSGATEAINIAIKGVAESYKSKGKHIITVSSEHSAVLDTCRFLESKGYEITYLPVKPNGLIDLTQLESVIRDDTILVSVMYVNNETGVLQPIKEIARLTHSVHAIFMSDCTQAVGKIPIQVDELGIDLMCFSGHKIYAPKGIGGLFIRQRGDRVKIPALFHGGGHERGLRSGTLNVPGIVALGTACELAQREMEGNAKQIGSLRNYLEAELLRINGTTVNGSINERLYNISNIVFNDADSDAIIMGLSSSDNPNFPLIAVSNGSACTSTSIEPSHVLIAMGLDEIACFSSIRFSLGKFNTTEEMDVVINAMKAVVNDLRAMAH